MIFQVQEFFCRKINIRQDFIRKRQLFSKTAKNLTLKQLWHTIPERSFIRVFCGDDHGAY